MSNKPLGSQKGHTHSDSAHVKITDLLDQRWEDPSERALTEQGGVFLCLAYMCGREAKSRGLWSHFPE